MEAITFVGLHDLEPIDQDLVNVLVTEYFEKVQREFRNLTSLKIHIKEYKKEGARKKYSIHIQAIAPTKIFESTRAADWDLASCCHKAFKDLIMQIQHCFHTERGWIKPYE